MLSPSRTSNKLSEPAPVTAGDIVTHADRRAGERPSAASRGRRGELGLAAAERVIGLLAHGGDAIRRWRRRRAVYRELISMDDRLLRDLGIARHDIPAIAAGLVRTRDELPSTAKHAPVNRHAGAPAPASAAGAAATTDRHVA